MEQSVLLSDGICVYEWSDLIIFPQNFFFTISMVDPFTVFDARYFQLVGLTHA